MNVLKAALLTFALAVAAPVLVAEEARQATLYKNPRCDCCEEYAKYLRETGFEVKIVATHNLTLIKKEHGVPESLEGCHTTLIDNYVIEGHVPIETLNKLLSERPAIKGVSLPGMPTGSPGMSGPKTEPFKILEIAEGSPKVFTVE